VKITEGQLLALVIFCQAMIVLLILLRVV